MESSQMAMCDSVALEEEDFAKADAKEAVCEATTEAIDEDIVTQTSHEPISRDREKSILNALDIKLSEISDLLNYLSNNEMDTELEKQIMNEVMHYFADSAKVDNRDLNNWLSQMMLDREDISFKIKKRSFELETTNLYKLTGVLKKGKNHLKFQLQCAEVVENKVFGEVKQDVVLLKIKEISFLEE